MIVAATGSLTFSTMGGGFRLGGLTMSLPSVLLMSFERRKALFYSQPGRAYWCVPFRFDAVLSL
jgi:hypothetical protein